MSGIFPGLIHEEEFEDTVADKALSNAREKAEKTVKPLGMKVTSVFAISPISFTQIRNDIFGDRGSHGYTAEEVTPQEKAADSSHYRLGPITVSREVHVIFLISPVGQ